jgi:hypothetical protein
MERIILFFLPMAKKTLFIEKMIFASNFLKKVLITKMKSRCIAVTRQGAQCRNLVFAFGERCRVHCTTRSSCSSHSSRPSRSSRPPHDIVAVPSCEEYFYINDGFVEIDGSIVFITRSDNDRVIRTIATDDEIRELNIRL